MINGHPDTRWEVNENKFRIECREDTRAEPFNVPVFNGFCRKPNADVYGPKPRMLGECLSVYVGAGRGDLAVSGSSSPEVNMVIWSSSQR